MILTFKRFSKNFKQFKLCLSRSSSNEPPAKAAKYKVVMMRHGQSDWNSKNLFCGWYNTEITPRGIEQAIEAGKAIRDAKFKFDIAFTSALKRAQITLHEILKVLGQEDIPVMKSWRLNERHYGSLTGARKRDVVIKYGATQVQIWRRSYNVPPPPMENSHPYYEAVTKDPIYKDGPPPKDFPRYESLKLTIERTLPYWYSTIVPEIKAGKRVLIVAHGNSLRGIIKHLERFTNTQIISLHLPNAMPFFYDLDEDVKPIGTMQFLGDPDAVKKAMESVAQEINR